jgi:hypothetical protein
MTKIAELFNIQGRFLRSAQLERDFRDSSALEGYVVTRTIRSSIERISSGLNANSGQRAWRITGDYGSGKSSFALLLAHLFSGRARELAPAVQNRVDIELLQKTPLFVPVLITGSREPLTPVLVRGLKEALKPFSENRKLQRSARAVDAFLRRDIRQTDEEVLALIERVAEEIAKSGEGSGLFIIIDELGKFLEFAALNPERQDILILQQLAEVSSRSGKNPIFTVSLLHQGFNAYADQLSQASQREWEKVAGRFEELVFDQPLDQVTHLIANALNVNADATPKGWEARAARIMRQTLSLEWFGVSSASSSISEIAETLYPLHPTVIPVLVKLFSRFGQNERSLFSFLLSNQPLALRAFSEQKASLTSLFRVHHLYDFAAASFGHILGLQSYRTHWNHIDSIVRSFSAKDQIQLSVLKTIGLLNLINSSDLQPTEQAIIVALGDGVQATEESVRDAIKDLHQEKKLLYFRGTKAGYWLWGHTSINLELAYEEAAKAVGSHRKATDLVKRYLDVRPIVARRHYIKTGNLRHFAIQYCSLAELERISSETIRDADGKLVIPLLETKEEMLQAQRIVEAMSWSSQAVLVGLTEPLASLSGLIQEVERWNHIEKSTPELKDDRYAYEEVSRRVSTATLTLERRVQHYVGLREASQSGEFMPIRWYRGGRLQPISTVSSFLSFLSDVCDEIYGQSPVVHNELLNRRVLSSAAAAARMRLLERMLESPGKQYLGMDPTKKPPEMSMYLSVLQETLLHRALDDQWKIAIPDEDHDPCRLRPALNQIYRILVEKPDQRINVETIFDEIRRAPFGVRDGLLPLFLLVTILQHQHEIAFYEEGTFKSQTTAPDILRLCKDPKSFELQWIKVEGVRLEVFNRLRTLFDLPPNESPRTEILDIVRPLCEFVAKLPPFSLQTAQLTKRARDVRYAILEARDPSKLLFNGLPIACGFPPLGNSNAWIDEKKDIGRFITELQSSLEELKVAMSALRGRIAKQIAKVFGLPQSLSRFQKTRDELALRSERLLVDVADIDLKAFCLRLFDNNMPEADWIESIGSLVAIVPPSRWKDKDENIFRERLNAIAQLFLRVESVNFGSNINAKSVGEAVRIAITKQDGTERQEVLFLTKKDQQEASRVAEGMRLFLGSNHSIALSALGKITWELLNAKDEQKQRIGA